VAAATKSVTSGGKLSPREIHACGHRGSHQGCHEFFSPQKISSVKNYPTLKFMLLTAATITSVPHASSTIPPLKTPLPRKFTAVTLCALLIDARSVCDG